MRSLQARVAGALGRAPLPRDRTTITATALLAGCVGVLAFQCVNWAVVNAVWTLPPAADSSLCRARGGGACWAVIHERWRFMLLGAYPYGAQWRPAVASVLFISLYAASARRAWWNLWLAGLWVAAPIVAIGLLGGGLFGLAAVSSEYWGGLPLTFLLSTVGFGAALPAAVVLALGRRSQLPALRALSTAYIELVRGVPFITFLFMASVMFPLFVPQGFTVDKLVRAGIAFVMVIAAHLAEVLRAGLDAIPKAQYEAAASMGLRFWPTTILITLPQALRVTIPALVNTFIGFFKDTSLVTVIGLFDLLGAGKAVIADARWVGFGVEVYIFVGAIYFTFCYAVSRYSRRLERLLMARSRY